MLTIQEYAFGNIQEGFKPQNLAIPCLHNITADNIQSHTGIQTKENII